jgi:hypothetical protein
MTVNVLDFLASNPKFANCTVDKKELRKCLLQTDGKMFARGVFWNIVSKHLGAGVYRLSLSPAA